MKSDFLLAITQLSAEKNLPKDVVLTAVETALVSAYKKDTFPAHQNIAVKINPNTGQVEVWAEKTVVESTTDPNCEITLDEARKLKDDAQIGDAVMVESTPSNAGRIAAQTAKQVILQRLHEAEHSAIFEEYADREGEVVSGVVQHFELGQIHIDLGRTEAILPAFEQVRTERYRIGQRLKVVLLQVARTNKGPRVIVSRSHPDLLRRLFELEVPEVYNGAVEIKAISREAGFRSKIAVAAKQEGIDPVGCCVGLRGIRIQNIVSELNGEKIDVIKWNPDVSAFIASALSPAHIISVTLNEGEQAATVVVPDKQLSLAIGKEGQNARLAAKLSGWRIDIKSATSAEAEALEKAKLAPKTEAAGEAAEATGEITAAEEIPADPEPVDLAVELTEEAVKETAEPLPAAEEIIIPPQIIFKPPVEAAKPMLRFAEDIMAPRPARTTAKTSKAKKKKKGAQAKEGPKEDIKPRKPRRGTDIEEDEEDY